ncbi:MAG: DUF5615 family PIN-like protein [Spirochaetaceae bacterium]|nr:DUF5615 family PIN-like protein [Spirochaetaceae bacterium]
MAVKIKIDENLPGTTAEVLRAAGHNVTTAIEEGLGGAGDPRLAAVCQAEGRAIVTLDRGLGDIRAYPPPEYHGIVVLRPRNQDIDTIVALTRRLISLLKTLSLAESLWIVDEQRVRIRR